jgi:hypothetical protein
MARLAPTNWRATSTLAADNSLDILARMEVLAGRVKDGATVPDPEDLLEGPTPSAILNGGVVASFSASLENEAALLAALAEDAGTISSRDLLGRLR